MHARRPTESTNKLEAQQLLICEQIFNDLAKVMTGDEEFSSKDKDMLDKQYIKALEAVVLAIKIRDAHNPPKIKQDIKAKTKPQCRFCPSKFFS